MSGERATVDLVVAERKRELERHRVVVDGDAVTPTETGDEPAAVVLTLTPPDADAVKRGELDLSVAFMRGTMKMAGDSAVLLRVLPVLSRSQPL
ncbi:MAG TPA: SCP2 sterol-binding domain-containing protein [Acidimicrobiia bacterium]